MVDLYTLTEYAVDYGLSQNIDHIISRLYSSRRRDVEVINGEINELSSYTESGLSISLLYKGINMHSFINTPSISALKNLIDKMLNHAKNISKYVTKKLKYSEYEGEEVNYIIKEDKPYIEYEEDFISYVSRLSKDIMSKESDLKIVNNVFKLNYIDEEKYIVSSDGAKILSRIPRIILSYDIMGKYGGEYLVKKGFFGGSGGLEILEHDSIRDNINEYIKAMENMLLNSSPTPEGYLNIVIGNELSGVISHEIIGHYFEADRVIGIDGRSRESYLSINDLNREIGSKEVFVSDDPTMPSTYGFYLYDDEGVKTRRRVLIREGIVNEYLTNREFALYVGGKSNGSARSQSFAYEPIVRVGVIFFEPGDYTLEELFKEARYGIYVKNIAGLDIDDKGMYQRYIGFEAYLIEGGEVTKPIKYPVIETNTLDLLNKLYGRSIDLEFYPYICGKGDPIQYIPISIGGPHMLFKKIKVLKR